MTKNRPSFLVCIGSSTGGPSALQAVLSKIPRGYLGAVVVVQHLGEEFSESLLDWLQESTGLICRIPVAGEMLQQGTMYLAGGGCHITINNAGAFEFEPASADEAHTPAINRLFCSAATHWTGPGVGVLLSGMGADGATGLKLMRDAGWETITQTQESCVVYGMPRAAVKLDASERAMEPSEIGKYLAGYAAKVSDSPALAIKKPFNRDLLEQLAAKAVGKAGRRKTLVK